MSEPAAATAEAHQPPAGSTAVQFGFWLYLMSDAVLFALLFATYVVMAGATAGGPSGPELFGLRELTIETALLLTSTLTIAFAHQQSLSGRAGAAVAWLAVTCLLGAGFLFVEVNELSGLVASGSGPGRSGFLSAFFTLVGTHGLHVTAGIVWGLTLIIQLLVKGASEAVTSRLLRMTLFWHFLDIVWVGVFSVVYLPGIAK